MEQPDYSKYTTEEPQAASASASASAPPIMVAGRWRRIGAFLIDALILGLGGLAAGAILAKPFTALGPWGRLLGFAIAVVYFGYTQSSKGGGQSLGMRVLGLKVIRQDGGLLDLRQAVGRATIFCVAYFLSGLSTYLSGGNPWINGILSTPLFAIYFSILYLLLFNRRTRQSLHDLAFRAYVVKTAPGPLALPVLPVWRGHAIIAGGTIVVLTVGGLLATLPIWPNNPFTAMLQLQQTVARMPGVYEAAIAVSFQQSQGVTAPILSVSTTIDNSVSDREALARSIARTGLENYPDGQNLRAVTVRLSSGYDIGIAQSYRSWNYAYPPIAWKSTP
ncbi:MULTISPECIES: RDD family protein [unclassified Duganella]|uniref:RDD family protein n=1 Tax=unclassified Duganella TaxID=2636909 RepID=UPI00088F2B30|nr:MULTISPECIES: RDD family protein [unclassified Duganella]SDG20416.1 Uncharacterized membrane protein YckC, RDD family [Duganella sp. OV458]SDJ27827.1 Uncharacterized membrane protein YckC, RDD family [Duganella sp. OV510]